MWYFFVTKVMKFMESKEYDVIIIRRSTNCQNEDPLYNDEDI